MNAEFGVSKSYLRIEKRGREQRLIVDFGLRLESDEELQLFLRGVGKALRDHEDEVLQMDPNDVRDRLKSLKELENKCYSKFSPFHP